jgi:hypothetical protein
MQGSLDGVDRRTVDVAARLATVLARPLDVFDQGAGRLEPLAAAEARAAAAHPAFRAAINRAVAGTLRLGEIAIDRTQLHRLTTSARGRTAVLLVSEKFDIVRSAAMQVGAAILHKRVLKFTLKADRMRIRTILGDDAYRVATQEAPLLHAVLAELDAGLPEAGNILGRDTNVDEASAQFTDFGLQALRGFVVCVEPALSPLMIHRWPSACDADARRCLVRPLGDTHCDHIVRLIRRRLQPWSAFIG